MAKATGKLTRDLIRKKMNSKDYNCSASNYNHNYFNSYLQE